MSFIPDIANVRWILNIIFLTFLSLEGYVEMATTINIIQYSA